MLSATRAAPRHLADVPLGGLDECCGSKNNPFQHLEIAEAAGSFILAAKAHSGRARLWDHALAWLSVGAGLGAAWWGVLHWSVVHPATHIYQPVRLRPA